TELKKKTGNRFKKSKALITLKQVQMLTNCTRLEKRLQGCRNANFPLSNGKTAPTSGEKVKSRKLKRNGGETMKKIELKFENEDGKTVTYSLDKPVEPVDPEAVKNAMDVIIEQNAFTSSGGDLIAKKSARVVDRTVEEIDLA